VALERAHSQGSDRGNALKMLMSGRPPASSTSTRAKSSKRCAVPSLIEHQSRPSVSITVAEDTEISAVSGIGAQQDLAHCFRRARAIQKA